ncbi:MAG: FAD-dependent oxidoreductase [Microbacteriaceae bacterium]|nr:FAD-dependent oxidoreductase [Microbacteriaceae bacterium]MDR9444516.1 FAD-dependent oxidoreductase [Microbacteriaceae bacterium]
MRLLIIGAGVFGHMHAIFACEKGYEVKLIERHSRPTMASVRNFGMIAVGGRKAGDELTAALRARTLWQDLSERYEELTFRATGSICVAVEDQEFEVMKHYAKYEDAALRGWEVLDADQVKDYNPGIRGDIRGGLYAATDAAVEPETVLTELRSELERFSNFSWHSNTEIVDVSQSGEIVTAKSRDGEIFEGDYAVVVPGADYSTLFADRLQSAPLKKTYVQMARMENPGFEIPTSISNADSLRYYPGYAGSQLADLPPQSELGKELVMQLLLQQRVDGTLTIGDSHQYVEPFDHELREDAYEYMVDSIEKIIGVAPKITSRWAGVYSQHLHGALSHRDQVDTRIHLLTGPAGRGNTLSPMIAEETIEEVINV